MAVIVVMGCLGNEIFGQKITAMRDSAQGGYNFWLYEPAQSTKGEGAEEKKPLIIFLHGASLMGKDMRKVLKYGPLDAINRGIKIEDFVIAPQTTNNWNADKIWKCVEWVKEHYPIDSNRISVVGMSLGGFGTFELSTKYYDKIAAGMMLCGGNTNDQYCGLTKMPFWIMHGTADKPVPISRSNSIVSAMAECGDTSRLIYTKLEGEGHSFPAKLFYLTETYQWLTSHSLKDKDRAVNRNVKITQKLISGAYGRLSGTKGNVDIRQAPDSHTDKENARQQKSNAADPAEQTGNGNGDGETLYYIVQPGNTLLQIATKYNMSLSRLCELNGIETKTILQIGQKLIVENGSAKANGTSENKQTSAKGKDNPSYHKVAKGDSLYAIAKKYHTTIEKLCELNNIKMDATLQIGQNIKLPK